MPRSRTLNQPLSFVQTKGLEAFDLPDYSVSEFSLNYFIEHVYTYIIICILYVL